MSDTKQFLGIEVGAASLKVALLDPAEKRIVKTAVLETESSPLDDVYTFETVLQGWIDENQLTVDGVALSVPAFRSVIRQIFVPAEAVKTIDEYLDWYLGLITNAEPGSYILDYKVLSGDATVGQTVLLIAVRKEWVDGLRKGFRSKSLLPKAMEVDVLSILNLMDFTSQATDKMECVIKADFSGVTMMWLTKDNLKALRCVSTLSLAGKSAEEAYPLLVDEIYNQFLLAQEEDLSFNVHSVNLCGEMATAPVFVEALGAKFADNEFVLMDEFPNLRLPVVAEDSVAVPCSTAAIGAALSLMEEGV
ncbi:MAG: hypothetical protein MJY78_08770 [Fibrobacter sp.]|nr:hypothetical protein [Fibrobacter sp.]